MKRATLVLVAALFVVLALSGIAFAQTPQEIYEDYVLDGRMDGDYTDAELQAFLENALIHQYGDPAVMISIDSAIRGLLGGGGGPKPPTGGQRENPPSAGGTPTTAPPTPPSASGPPSPPSTGGPVSPPSTSGYADIPDTDAGENPPAGEQVASLPSGGEVVNLPGAGAPRSFPFTTTQVVLMVIGAAVLIGAGVGIAKLVAGARG